jgi:hypothetical protein
MCHRRDEPVAVFSRVAGVRRFLRDEACPMGSAIKFNEYDRWHSGCGLVFGVLRCQWLTRSDSFASANGERCALSREGQKSARCLNT